MVLGRRSKEVNIRGLVLGVHRLVETPLFFSRASVIDRVLSLAPCKSGSRETPCTFAVPFLAVLLSYS